MHWIITADHISQPNGKSHLHRMRCPPDLADCFRMASPEERLKLRAEFLATMTDEFRLFDGDGELYYVGLCKDLDNQDEESAFGPLDWAMNDVGCASMQCRKIGATDWAEL